MPIGNNEKSVSFTNGSHHSDKSLCMTVFNLAMFDVVLMGIFSLLFSESFMLSSLVVHIFTYLFIINDIFPRRQKSSFNLM